MKNLLLLTIVLLLFGCASIPAYHSAALNSDISYDAGTDVTTYLAPNYGNVLLPGEWRRAVAYRTFNGQNYLENKNGDIIYVAVYKQSDFGFHKKYMTDIQFLDMHQEWIKEHLSKQGITVSLEEKSDDYYISRAYGDDVDNTTLAYAKGGLLKVYSVHKTSMGLAERKTLLMKIYRENLI